MESCFAGRISRLTVFPNVAQPSLAASVAGWKPALPSISFASIDKLSHTANIPMPHRTTANSKHVTKQITPLRRSGGPARRGARRFRPPCLARHPDAAADRRALADGGALPPHSCRGAARARRADLYGGRPPAGRPQRRGNLLDCWNGPVFRIALRLGLGRAARIRLDHASGRTPAAGRLDSHRGPWLAHLPK